MPNAAKPTNNFAKAIRLIRKSKGMSQEEFGVLSSRTYVSALERGMKSPTLSKVDALAEVMDVHPLTLLALAYSETHDQEAVVKLLERIASEISLIDNPVEG
jgi:transcriptional regulator with XRE-family HTH domain